MTDYKKSKTTLSALLIGIFIGMLIMLLICDAVAVKATEKYGIRQFNRGVSEMKDLCISTLEENMRYRNDK